MEVTGTNGITYQVRFTNDGNFEIERDDAVTGLRKVFVFRDIAIGSAMSKRKEVVFYSYDITPTGERINQDRHSFKDSDLEFAAFLQSEWWECLKNAILNDFLKKIEFTEAIQPYTEN